MSGLDELNRGETKLYCLQRGSETDRATVRAAIPELAQLSPAFEDPAISAWVTAWRSTSYKDFMEIPMAIPAPNYSLIQHQRDSAIVGMQMARIARQEWGRPIDEDVLLAVLLLHDVDAPIIYARTGEGLAYSVEGRTMPHGVLGAMILRDVGFPDSVVSVVATHAMDSPFHSEALEGWVLHYADLFAADHALPLGGFTPVYRQKRH